MERMEGWGWCLALGWVGIIMLCNSEYSMGIGVCGVGFKPRTTGIVRIIVMCR